MKRTAALSYCLSYWLIAVSALHAQTSPLDFMNHNRPVADAHNCYPEHGQWGDRIERALGAGFPIGIEQDLAWYVPPSGPGRVVVSHSAKTTGAEPTLRAYFFERVRPIIEAALKKNDTASWPIIVVHFDFKDVQKPLLEAVWSLLGEYESWMSTAIKTRDPAELAPIDRKPLLVLTEDSDEQEQVFFDAVPVGARLRLFGSAHTAPVEEKRTAERNRLLVTLPPERLLVGHPDSTTAALVEQRMVRGGGRRTASGRRLDRGRRPAITRVGRLCPCPGFLDSLLYPGWLSFGRRQRLGRGLQFRFARRRDGAMESGHRRRGEPDCVGSLRGSGQAGEESG